VNFYKLFNLLRTGNSDLGVRSDLAKKATFAQGTTRYNCCRTPDTTRSPNWRATLSWRGAVRNKMSACLSSLP